MDRTPFNQEPLPPPYSTHTSTSPIGFQHINQNPPYPVNNAPLHPTPQVYNSGFPPQQYQPAPPPPLNAYNAPTAVQTTYTSPPLVNQQPTIAALNATPRYRPFRGIGSTHRKQAYIAFAIFGVILVVFLILFFTIFTKASRDMDEAQKRHDEFRKKHFPDSW